ncbi:alpha/beta hydrolase [Arthrobacter sp. CAU 1506]|uniref:alpha/beta hydrolase n=1 Tax=Arthrobacter sp. CAU 1506 TaxID=2560052 RepID=UPI00145C97CC|nr:alpha/beta hydrolase [Arthrobacter sp. CAU 1506]
MIAPDRAKATDTVYAPLHDLAPFGDVVIERDFVYGDHPRHRLDVFSPKAVSPEKLPVLVFVHGGNFVAGQKHTEGSPFYDNVGAWAVRHGFIGVTISYRLAPAAQYPSGIEDLNAVVAWLRSNIGTLNGNPDHIVLMGASAGAIHVASYLAAAALDEAPVAGTILLSGLYDLTVVPRERVLDNYYGTKRDLAPVSPLPGLVQSAVPIMVVVTEMDPPEHQRQFLGLAQALLERNGQLPRMVYLAGHNHFSEVVHLGTDDEVLGTELASFVRGLGKETG